MNRTERRRAAATSQATPQRIGNPEAARHFHDAVQHLKSGRLSESEVAHRRVLSHIPNHAPSLHHLGLIAFKRQELTDAVDYIRRSLAAQPDYHEAWLNLAIILGEMRRSREAIEACRQCLALQPKNSEPHTVLGNLLRVAESDAEAMAAYFTALELKPDQPLDLTRLAELLFKSGQTEAAATRCRRALDLDPSLEDALILERRIAISSRSVDAIAAEFQAQSKSGDELAKRLDELGTHLRADRQSEEAAKICRRAIAADPGNADYHFNLALALESMGHLDEALASYQAGLAIEPERAQAYASVGNLLRTMNMPTGAIQALEYAVKLDPELASAYLRSCGAVQAIRPTRESKSGIRKMSRMRTGLHRQQIRVRKPAPYFVRLGRRRRGRALLPRRIPEEAGRRRAVPAHFPLVEQGRSAQGRTRLPQDVRRASGGAIQNP
jgi:tetratricopeptide (TPR) repeat protein